MSTTYSLQNLLLDDPPLDHEAMLGPVVQMRWMNNLCRLALTEELDRHRAERGEYTEHDAEIRRLRRSSMHPSAGRYYVVKGKINRLFKNIEPEQASQIVEHWLARQLVPEAVEPDDCDDSEFECDPPNDQPSRSPVLTAVSEHGGPNGPAPDYPAPAYPALDEHAEPSWVEEREPAAPSLLNGSEVRENFAEPECDFPNDGPSPAALARTSDSSAYAPSPLPARSLASPVEVTNIEGCPEPNYSFPIPHSHFPIAANHSLAKPHPRRLRRPPGRLARFAAVAVIALLSAALAITARRLIQSTTNQPPPTAPTSKTIPKDSPNIRGSPPASISPVSPSLPIPHSPFPIRKSPTKTPTTSPGARSPPVTGLDPTVRFPYFINRPVSHLIQAPP